MARWLGLDLGGTNTKVAVVDDQQWRVVEQDAQPTDRRSPQQAVQTCAGLAARWASAADVRGVGVTLPGLFDGAGRAVIVPNIPGAWAGVPVRAPVHECTGLPTTLVNDARAFALAETRLGVARGLRDVVGVVLGTGVGGAVVLGGRLFLGHAGNAGEVGHQVLVPDGPQCGCGNRGCLEALVRADVLASAAGHTTVADAAAAAAGGDERACAALADAGQWIGRGLANLVTVLTPEAVVVGGGVAQAGDLLLEPLRQALRTGTPLVPWGSYQVLTALLGPLAGAVGAAVAASDVAASETTGNDDDNEASQVGLGA